MKSNCKPWNVQRQRTIVKIPTKKTVIYYYSLCLKTSGYDSNELLAHFVEWKIHFAVSNHPFMSAFSFFLLFTPNHSDTMWCTVVLFMPVGIEMKWKKKYFILLFRCGARSASLFCLDGTDITASIFAHTLSFSIRKNRVKQWNFEMWHFDSDDFFSHSFD